MGYFPGLEEGSHLTDVFKKFGMGLENLTAFHDDILRGESELTIAERELIAAFVSASNDCQFCYNAHKVYAVSFGIDENVFDALIADVDSAPIDEKLKPILKYCRKLTLTPSKMVQGDVDSVMAAGWGGEALHTAVLVTGLFNLMNRIIFSHGLPSNESAYSERKSTILERSLKDRTAANSADIGSKPYADFAKMVKNK